MNRFLLAFSFIASTFMIISCNPPAGKQEEQHPDILVSHIDSTVKPGDDFFDYANGKWFRQNPIPANDQSNGIWNLIQDTINSQIHKICTSSSSAAKNEAGSNKQKIGDFYYTGMDSTELNKNGLEFLKNDIKSIDGIKDIKGLVKTSSYLHTFGANAMFRFNVDQDDKISSKYAVFIGQGGLSLPDRRYYFDNDARSSDIRTKFVSHLYRVFMILGYDDAKAKQASENLMKLETAIAKTSRKREDTRDAIKNYNKISFHQLTELTPLFDWTVFTKKMGLNNIDTVVVGQPEFLKALNGYLKSFALEDWKNYLKYQLLSVCAASLDDKTYLEYFNFYAGALRGIKTPKPRWKRVVEQTNSSIGELIAQVYVTEYLPKGAKEKLQEIGSNIKSVYADRIKNVEWMSEVTKQKALKKLNAIIMKLGYPDKWKDMSKLVINKTSYVQNVINANKWRFYYMISKYGKPVDRSEWNMEPQTLNAYYNPSNNEIVMPGCIITIPGYEHKMADDALLYSRIGMIFGHEITHGFDDQGCKYDEAGNLHNWWTKEDSAKFFTKTKMIVEQYNRYITVDSLHINGENTQGENIADLGGVIMSFEAFKRTDQYKNHEVVGGIEPVKRFFLGYALGWMVNMRPEAIANQIKSNEHSPAKFRVIGPLSNIKEFYSAFGVRQGDKMWRADKDIVKIW